jgi:hypothetical protein
MFGLGGHHQRHHHRCQKRISIQKRMLHNSLMHLEESPQVMHCRLEQDEKKGRHYVLSYAMASNPLADVLSLLAAASC